MYTRIRFVNMKISTHEKLLNVDWTLTPNDGAIISENPQCTKKIIYIFIIIIYGWGAIVRKKKLSTTK